MFGKLFKSAKKIQNKELMEALIASCLLVAAADGSIGDDERKKLEALIVNNDNLSGFSKPDLQKTIAQFSGVLNADFGVGRLKMLRQIQDVSENTSDSEEVFVNALAIANTDGSIDEKELKVLKEIGRTLNINLADYDL